MGQFIGKTIIEGGQGRTIKKYDLNDIEVDQLDKVMVKQELDHRLKGQSKLYQMLNTHKVNHLLLILKTLKI